MVKTFISIPGAKRLVVSGYMDLPCRSLNMETRGIHDRSEARCTPSGKFAGCTFLELSESCSIGPRGRLSHRDVVHFLTDGKQSFTVTAGNFG